MCVCVCGGRWLLHNLLLLMLSSGHTTSKVFISGFEPALAPLSARKQQQEMLSEPKNRIRKRSGTIKLVVASLVEKQL